MLIFAQFERELTSERTKDKKIHRAQKGMWNGGSVSSGYKSEDKRLVIKKEIPASAGWENSCKSSVWLAIANEVRIRIMASQDEFFIPELKY